MAKRTVAGIPVGPQRAASPVRERGTIPAGHLTRRRAARVGGATVEAAYALVEASPEPLRRHGHPVATRTAERLGAGERLRR
ncbi:hypothetical protein [Streptomyces luteogriseus]|uniref:hypothetical protein n=1 Tax=Streptomyces luteogriseus TaxID=68233 RepID=UPI0037120D0D